MNKNCVNLTVFEFIACLDTWAWLVCGHPSIFTDFAHKLWKLLLLTLLNEWYGQVCLFLYLSGHFFSSSLSSSSTMCLQGLHPHCSSFKPSWSTDFGDLCSFWKASTQPSLYHGFAIFPKQNNNKLLFMLSPTKFLLSFCKLLPTGCGPNPSSLTVSTWNVFID